MIETRIEPAPRELAERLAERAARLAAARAEGTARARRADPWRWRKAGLLWPLFGKG